MVSNLANIEQVKAVFRVFILDLDGTLMNGYAPVPGVAQVIFNLFVEDNKKVLFYSNGGYCSL